MLFFLFFNFLTSSFFSPIEKNSQFQLRDEIITQQNEIKADCIAETLKQQHLVINENEREKVMR